MNGYEAIKRFRDQFRVKSDEPVGFWATHGKATIENDERTLQVIATTDDVDLDGEVVVPEGMRNDYFRRNGKIFVDHQYDIANVVGSLRSTSPIMVQNVQVGWRVRFYVLRLPLGDDILTMVREGAPPGASIGFIARDFGRPEPDEKARFTRNGKSPVSIVRELDWMETSMTAWPCNVACQMLDARPVVDEAKAGIIDGLLVKGRIRPESAYALGFPRERKGPVRAPVVIKCVA